MSGYLPQPHEGIRGQGRPGWLLSLDEEAVPFRDAILALTRHLGSATLVGNPAPVVRRMSDRMRAPRAGDLVASRQALIARDPDTRLKGLGVLLHPGRREWATRDAEWAEFCEQERAAAPDPCSLSLIVSLENRATDTAFYIQYGPDAGDICRWTNDEAVMVPAEVSSFSQDAAATREITADGLESATFTRDSLLGGLADSGFHLNLPRKDA